MKQAEHRSAISAVWIWAIPVAALGVVVWLGVRSLAAGGPDITVTFADAGGVKAGNTKVTYNKMEVGQVESVKLHKDLQAADVTLSMDSDMDGHLGPGTRFWITGQTFTLNDLSSIKSLVAGPTIAMNPHDGPTQHLIRGLDAAPVLSHEPAGQQYVLHASTLGSISRGAPVYYRELEVGEVQGYTFDPPDKFKIFAFVKAPYAKLVNAGSRFWNASAARLAMGSGGLSLSLLSPTALVTGAIAFETPDSAGPTAKGGADFALYSDEDHARYAPDTDAVAFRVELPDAEATALDVGAPVKLGTRRIGSVTGTQLRLRDDHTLTSNVTIAIDPHLLRISGGPGGSGDQQTEAILALLVEQGLRAQLGSSTPVVGAKEIDLRFSPGAAAARLSADSPPVIPSIPAGDIAGIMRQVSDVTAKLDALPLSQIADNVRDATQRLDRLSASPELVQTLQRLDQSVSNIDEVTQQARKQVGSLLTQLRQAAVQAQAAIRAVHGLIGGDGGVVGDGAEQSDLPHALYELTQAARSLRELADLLQRQPDAVVFGKATKP